MMKMMKKRRRRRRISKIRFDPDSSCLCRFVFHDTLTKSPSNTPGAAPSRSTKSAKPESSSSKRAGPSAGYGERYLTNMLFRSIEGLSFLISSDQHSNNAIAPRSAPNGDGSNGKHTPHDSNSRSYASITQSRGDSVSRPKDEDARAAKSGTLHFMIDAGDYSDVDT